MSKLQQPSYYSLGAVSFDTRLSRLTRFAMSPRNCSGVLLLAISSTLGAWTSVSRSRGLSKASPSPPMSQGLLVVVMVGSVSVGGGPPARHHSNYSPALKFFWHIYHSILFNISCVSLTFPELTWRIVIDSCQLHQRKDQRRISVSQWRSNQPLSYMYGWTDVISRG